MVITALTAQNAVYSPGVTVEKNTNPDWDADYTATFVYEDKDARDAERVTVSGNFQFYSLNDPVVKNYEKTADPTGAKVYSAYDYDKDNAMFNVSGGQNNDTPIYELEETGDERFEITLPLPGNQYFYDYTVEYSDGSKVTIQDPVNPSKKNSLTDHDSDTVFSMLETVKIQQQDRSIFIQELTVKQGNMNLLNTRMHITQMKKHSH